MTLQVTSRYTVWYINYCGGKYKIEEDSNFNVTVFVWTDGGWRGLIHNDLILKEIISGYHKLKNIYGIMGGTNDDTI